MPTLYKNEENTFDYDDIILIPNKNTLQSRSHANTKTQLGKHTFEIPVVPANMSTIVNEETCQWLAERGHFYIMHRFDTNPITFTQKMHEKGLIASISLGIKQTDYETVDKLKELNITPEYITVDVAHGDSDPVFHIIKYIRQHLPNTYIIAGNVATIEGATRLAEAGADAVKAGVGPGCFEAGTKVLTKQGLKAIEDIELGDLVLTHTGAYKAVTHRFIYETNDEIMDINGIKTTPEHEFYVCLKEDLSKVTEENYKDFCFWVKAKDLNPELHLTVSIEN